MLRQNKKFGKLLIMVAVRFEVLIPHSVRITHMCIVIAIVPGIVMYAIIRLSFQYEILLYQHAKPQLTENQPKSQPPPPFQTSFKVGQVMRRKFLETLFDTSASTTPFSHTFHTPLNITPQRQ